ncbi:diguanylate phosphodiesterase [Sphingomonas sp. MM-1]|uniref:EAL domain-containing protein n=1 Tax=Sphingomonas sp. MM-1 TaxID=745310 RepID=UPI0002C07486|nr:EAL domain-containing protein [Sphingomonas sp. MM-1]AGH50294.1 diguanylate phosphodiesterase [Sphingomonas sp. MM-1]
MGSTPFHISRSRYGPNLRILCAALLIGLVVGALGLFLPVEMAARTIRGKLHADQASGSIVVVAVDDPSVAELGPWPWPRDQIGQIVGKLRAAGAKQIHLDIDLSSPGKPAEDAALEDALRAAKGHVSLSSRLLVDMVAGTQADTRPLPRFTRHATMANTNLWVDRDSKIWAHPYALELATGVMPSLASLLSGVQGNEGAQFPLDYAIDVRSVPVVSARDIAKGRWDSKIVAGRKVIVAQTSTGAEHYFMPGYALVPAAFFHVIAAETLIAGRPIALGWMPPLILAGMIAAIFLTLRNRTHARIVLAGGYGLFLIGPIFLEHHHIFPDIMASLVTMTVVAVVHLYKNLRRAYHVRGTTNSISGLPNLNALRQREEAALGTLVVARIQNFAEITTALPQEYERELVEQITSRFSFGTTGAAIYQADEGIFIWVAQTQNDEMLIEQLNGLHALFRSPVIVSAQLVDVTVTFGLDNDSSRPLMQRVSSALVAADEAAKEGLRCATFDPATLEDAQWKLSLLGRLDQAIERGEIWVAYQPKIDLANDRIIGAEALARWKHPEKGEIFPSQFIVAAERSGRIENLTAHVLDSAVGLAARINRSGYPFSIAVNLSARLLDKPGLIGMVEQTLARHALPAGLLILEVTETTAMASQSESFANLERLSAMGVQLSIDDYGTGLSTLEYLKKIPAGEIKIDRSFVGMLDKSQGDRIMVHSTIQLAHSLGRKVVAEGVENAATLAELRRMQCDFVQGYHTGRPMPAPALINQLPANARETAA